MSTTTLSSQHSASVPTALRDGVAFAVTVAVFYALCTVVWFVAPGPFLGFMNSLFHGMDYSLLMRPASFSITGFLQALVVMSVWAFLAGTFFGWLRQRLVG